MTDEELVAALAEVLPFRIERFFNGAIAESPTHSERMKTVHALLPVVRRVAEQRAAEELLAAADGLVYAPAATANLLRARAAALTATPNHGRNATS